jgi:polyribonucleotide nucleotidyltransferase
VAGVRVGYLPGTGFVVNPSVAQMGASQLDLLVAGTRDAVLMIEGFADFLSEEQMLQVRGG